MSAFTPFVYIYAIYSCGVPRVSHRRSLPVIGIQEMSLCRRMIVGLTPCIHSKFRGWTRKIIDADGDAGIGSPKGLHEP